MFNYFELNNEKDFKYLLNAIGEDVSVNQTPTRALITNNENPNYDDKNISTLKPIKRGDLVNHLNRDWLIISEVNGKRYNKYKGIMRNCDYKIKFNFNSVIKEFPVIMDGGGFDIENNTYFNFPTGTIAVTIQENEDTLKIELTDRFIKLNSPWKITGIDRTKKGLIVFKGEKDYWATGDDKVNEVVE